MTAVVLQTKRAMAAFMSPTNVRRFARSTAGRRSLFKRARSIPWLGASLVLLLVCAPAHFLSLWLARPTQTRARRHTTKALSALIPLFIALSPDWNRKLADNNSLRRQLMLLAIIGSRPCPLSFAQSCSSLLLLYCL